MNILDIVGPVMVGPSSSHTAGAVRIGQTVGKLLGERVVNAKIGLHGSFLATGRGHGTDRAIVAGLLGLAVDDPRIPESFAEAKKAGLSFSFEGISLMNAHPNSVRLEVTGESGRKLEAIGASIGGGRIRICEIDGLTANFSGEAPTLVVYNQDKPYRKSNVSSGRSRDQYCNDAGVPGRTRRTCRYGNRSGSGSAAGADCSAGAGRGH